MKRRNWFTCCWLSWLLLALLLVTTRGYGADLPEFLQNSCTWESTDIVVVNGNGAVLETWKGDLRPGAQLPIDQMSLPESPELAGLLADRKDYPDRVSGERLILFLIREKPKKKKELQWKPAAPWGGMRVSVVWVENSMVYAFRQFNNPGPQELWPMEKTEKRLKQEVEALLMKQESLREAAEIDDPAERAKRMVPFIDTNSHHCQDMALQILKDCGTAALPVLRKMLSQRKRMMMHDEVIKAMVAVGGQKVRSDLLDLVEKEMDFWKAEGPNQKDSWSGEASCHYYRLREALDQLADMGVPEDRREVMKDLHDLWLSMPHLRNHGRGIGPDGEYTRESHIVHETEAILRGKSKDK